MCSKDTVFSQLNALGIYLKIGSFNLTQLFFLRPPYNWGPAKNINDMRFSAIITDSQRPTL